MEAAASEPNYYHVLGVSTRVDRESLRKAFHHLTKLYHPDKNPSHLETFKEISRAYRVLSDPEQRRQYDVKLHRNSQRQMREYMMSGGNMAAGGVGGGMGRAPQGVGGGFGHHVHHSWDTSRVQIVRCAHCHGTGSVVRYERLGRGLMKEIRVLCMACSGRGTWCKLFSLQK